MGTINQPFISPQGNSGISLLIPKYMLGFIYYYIGEVENCSI
jgi:hypothetical protein